MGSRAKSLLVSDLRPARLAALVDAVTAAHLDGLLITSLPNIRYLTGFSGSSALLFVTPRDTLFVTDFSPPLENPRKGFWSILVGSLEGKDYAVVQTFDLNGGATSWRRNHPHPVFSPDGKRLYFNSAEGPWSRLMVAETGQ